MRKHQIIHEETDLNGAISKKTQTWVDNVNSEEPPFVKLYLSDMLFLLNIPTKYLPVLLILTRNMNYKNQVSCIDYNKISWCDELGIKINTFEHALVELTKRQVIKRRARGFYEVNQQFFGKGRWNKIEEIDVNIKYSAKGKQVNLKNIKGEKFSPFAVFAGGNI